MPGLKPIKHGELIKKLRKFGFEGPYAGGKHQFMVRGSFRMAIPNPHGKTIGVALLARILRQAGIEPDEWEEA